ncbi:DMT family transporter [Agarivorans sp. QJM3NY_25]|uniref:DMT family transporter n=1 Tax=Agarivorans sp. QJM3NY_25 TaxID=3421430 RepID=UPI003D7E43F9
MNDSIQLEVKVTKKNHRKLYVPVLEIALLSVAIFWGTSYGLTKQALIYSSVMVFIMLRFSVAFLSLLPMALRDIYMGRSKDWKVAFPTGSILAAIFFFEVTGVFQTSASKAAFLISLSVIFTSFVEVFINKNAISRGMFFLAVSSVVGVFLLTDSSGLELTLSRGDYFILSAALLRAMMVTTTKRITQDKVITNVTLTCIQSLVVAASAGGVILYNSGLNMTFPTNVEFWLIMGYLVVCCTLFAFFVQNHAVRKLSPTKVSLLMGSEPMFGAIFAVIWLNESLSALQVLGGCIIFASVMVASIPKKIEPN